MISRKKETRPGGRQPAGHGSLAATVGALLLTLTGCDPADGQNEKEGRVGAAVTIEALGETPRLVYPQTARVDQVDNYHGKEVADPYRWLEQDVRESQAVADWVKAQNEVSFAYLEKLPQRAAIRARLSQLWNHERFGQPQKEGSRYFYSHNDGLQNQDVMYAQKELSGGAEKILDPNAWSEDGTVALGGFYASRGGIPDRRGLDTTQALGGDGRQQRGSLGRCGGEPAPGAIWRRPAGSRRDGHAALSQIHCGAFLDR